jgi:hypothetical protein
MVKLKTRTMKFDNLEEVERAEKYWRIEPKSSGGYELQLPTKLNEEIKRFMGSKDFEMDVTKEGDDTLRVTLTPKKSSRIKKITK